MMSDTGPLSGVGAAGAAPGCSGPPEPPPTLQGDRPGCGPLSPQQGSTVISTRVEPQCAVPLPKQSRLSLVPTILADAKHFVTEVHRHHGPPTGHRFSVGVKDDQDTVRGVMTMGRAVARKTDQYAILEVTRVASDGCPNACSFLYGAACRIHRVHGFKYAQTFTLLSEPGTSLVAAGWKPVAVTDGGTHDRPSRRRVDSSPTDPKVRWECRCGASERIEWPIKDEVA